MTRAAVVLLFLLPVSSWADLMPILDITGGGTAAVPLADAVGGWQFRVTNPITISALGLWDEGSLPLEISHQVGLWTLGETLLATATVDNTSTPVTSASPDGRWLFTDITPIALAPGDYVLGAVWGDPIIGADFFRVNTTAPVTSGVTFSGSRGKTLLASPILVFPDQGPGGNGTFGPNAAFNVVPEPNSALLLLSGVVICAGLKTYAMGSAYCARIRVLHQLRSSPWLLASARIPPSSA